MIVEEGRRDWRRFILRYETLHQNEGPSPTLDMRAIGDVRFHAHM